MSDHEVLLLTVNDVEFLFCCSRLTREQRMTIEIITETDFDGEENSAELYEMTSSELCEWFREQVRRGGIELESLAINHEFSISNGNNHQFRR